MPRAASVVAGTERRRARFVTESTARGGAAKAVAAVRAAYDLAVLVDSVRARLELAAHGPFDGLALTGDLRAAMGAAGARSTALRAALAGAPSTSALAGAAHGLLDWLEARVDLVGNVGAGPPPGAHDGSRAEHTFAIAAPSSDGGGAAARAGMAGRLLDWYVLDAAAPGEPQLMPPRRCSPAQRVGDGLDTRVSFLGAAAPR